MVDFVQYHKTPVISPGLTFVQKTFWWAYSRGSLLLEGNLHFKMASSQKQLTLTVHWLMFGRFIIRRIIMSVICLCVCGGGGGGGGGEEGALFGWAFVFLFFFGGG